MTAENKKTFLGQLLGEVLSALLGIFISKWPQLVAKLRKKIPAPVEEKVTEVIDLVNALKVFDVNGGVSLIDYLLPEDTSDEKVTFLRALLDGVLKNERVVDIPTNELTGGQLLAIASAMVAGYTGMSKGQAALTTQVMYSDVYEKVA